jgi:SpoVK/Ycf46/Vps4 family AAA+-type ATPase
LILADNLACLARHDEENVIGTPVKGKRFAVLQQQTRGWDEPERTESNLGSVLKNSFRGRPLFMQLRATFLIQPKAHRFVPCLDLLMLLLRVIRQKRSLNDWGVSPLATIGSRVRTYLPRQFNLSRFVRSQAFGEIMLRIDLCR